MLYLLPLSGLPGRALHAKQHSADRCCNKATKLRGKMKNLKVSLRQCEAGSTPVECECPSWNIDKCINKYSLALAGSEAECNSCHPSCDYANGEMFDGANCVVPTTAETPAAEECYVPGFELRWSSVMDLYNLVDHDTFTSLLTDVNTVEEAMSKFVAPAKNEMKRQ